MNLIFSLVFTLICKPGIIYGYGDLKEYQNLPSMEFQGINDSEYYNYNDIQLENGSYLYVSNEKDTVWFYIEDYVNLPENQDFIEVEYTKK